MLATGLLVCCAAVSAAELEFEGEPVQGGLIVARAPAEATVTLDGEPVVRASDGTFLIGFGRDDTEARRLVVEFGDGERRVVRELVPRDREFDIQRIDGLPPKQVTPDPEALERIRLEAQMTREARRRVDDRTDFAAGFIWPVTGPITGVYGSQRILNNKPRSPHWGVDIAAPTGTPVRAPAAGVVTLAHPDMYFSGGTLLVDHGLGLSSAFLHLDEILVEAGQRVEQGEVIARVGATGRVTGAHLDWRMNLGETRIDPQLLLGEMPDAAAAASGN
ncbi:MAG: M23 family metallopeptidase [Wenzhouxiangellaceae bacterium]|nr:M23 family metallopeptidase [Wenzhouxiangellaceae bacterium]